MEKRRLNESTSQIGYNLTDEQNTLISQGLQELLSSPPKPNRAARRKATSNRMIGEVGKMHFTPLELAAMRRISAAGRKANVLRLRMSR